MSLNTKKIKTDFCVIGGGMAGLNAAITAARLGVKVVLVHERPVLGGNASSEIRMWICGTQDYAYRETGLSEEINLENYYYNSTKNYYLWDAILYNKVQEEKNILPLLNCTCFDAKMEETKIKYVTAYQMTTQTIYEIEADIFADCSGDSILAPLTGAEYMYGRESQTEYDEPMKTHIERDEKTMGNSCLLQARKTDKKIEFHAPKWAEKVSVEKLKSKHVDLFNPYENFWYIELGGVTNVIEQAENINKRLIALCLGVWDTIKNSGEFNADNFELEFMGFLGAKRESRRMKGEYVLTAKDIMQGRIFSDTVAYGGWPLDDHNPEGFDGNRSNYTIVVKKPYGIPYRCLYSSNIDNLLFAGRNISATHMAMSSARVMGTCSIIGQAVGAATSLCKNYGILPRGVNDYIDELQQILLVNDCYLPGVDRKVSLLSLRSVLSGEKDCEILRNGKDRNFTDEQNSVEFSIGESAEYTFSEPVEVKMVKIVFDSDLLRDTFEMSYCEKHHSMRCNILDDSPIMHMPETLVKSYSLELVLADGSKKLIQEKENKKRNVLICVEEKVKNVKLTVYENWGGHSTSGVFAFELL